jgi:phosphatidylinositol 4-kinase
LSFHLTHSLLSVGNTFSSLRETVLESLSTYLQSCLQIANAVPAAQYPEEETNGYGEEQEAAEVASVAVSIIGFLEASASYAHFWTQDERLVVIKTLQDILSERFLIAVETASSTIRNSDGSYHGFRDWRRYTKRYAAHGRPLGAMLLQQGFMKFVVSCISLLVADPETLSKQKLLDQYVLSDRPAAADGEDVDTSMVEYLTDLMTDEIRLLEDGSDYLQLGSAWQQRLAFSVKTEALTGFLCCMIIDEETADPEVLLSWLEDTLANQVQMADEELANVVLKCMAIIARSAPETASNLGRSILRFIVQGGSTGSVVESAARCLAYIVQILSQDAIITTLYSLGNVLSSGSAPDKQHPSVTADGSMARNSTPYNQQHAGSMISLSINDEEETSLVYGNVAQAIVTIASSCNDGKIITLSQSMLLQKIGRVSLSVDACIIEKAAGLAANGGQVELRALLKLYARLSHDAIRQGNQLIVDAVSGML